MGNEVSICVKENVSANADNFISQNYKNLHALSQTKKLRYDEHKIDCSFGHMTRINNFRARACRKPKEALNTHEEFVARICDMKPKSVPTRMRGLC